MYPRAYLYWHYDRPLRQRCWSNRRGGPPLTLTAFARPEPAPTWIYPPQLGMPQRPELPPVSDVLDEPTWFWVQQAREPDHEPVYSTFGPDNPEPDTWPHIETGTNRTVVIVAMVGLAELLLALLLLWRWQQNRLRVSR
jgi:hypothetical protein